MTTTTVIPFPQAKIDATLWSDIHTEFAALDKDMPGGDVLLLAGDILLIRAFHGEKQYKQIKDRAETFIESCARHYKRIYMVGGNHEFYHVDFNTAYQKIRPFLAKHGVTLLDAEHVELSKDVLLFGATLWMDFDKGDIHKQRIARFGMNDFRVIKNFTTERAIAEFDRAMAALSILCMENPDKTIVVMTHHAPSYQGISPEHVNSELNPAYASHLESFITAHPNIKYWMHGHTHIQKEYEIAQCKVFSNARGYSGYERSADVFNPGKRIEICHE